MGDNPRVIRMKLVSFFLPDKRREERTLKRRKTEEEHENHERWLITYADLITLLLAFFIMMYVFSKKDAQKYDEVVGHLKTIFTGASGTSGQAKDAGLRSLLIYRSR